MKLSYSTFYSDKWSKIQAYTFQKLGKIKVSRTELEMTQAFHGSCLPAALLSKQTDSGLTRRSLFNINTWRERGFLTGCRGKMRGPRTPLSDSLCFPRVNILCGWPEAVWGLEPASPAETSQEEGRGVSVCEGHRLATPGPVNFLRVLLLWWVERWPQRYVHILSHGTYGCYLVRRQKSEYYPIWQKM